MELKTQRQWLEKDLERAVSKYGPDSASVKDLKAQIASLGTVRHPSQLAVLNPSMEQSVPQSIAEKSRLISARSNAADDEPAV